MLNTNKIDKFIGGCSCEDKMSKKIEINGKIYKEVGSTQRTQKSKKRTNKSIRQLGLSGEITQKKIAGPLRPNEKRGMSIKQLEHANKLKKVHDNVRIVTNSKKGDQLEKGEYKKVLLEEMSKMFPKKCTGKGLMGNGLVGGRKKNPNYF